MAPSRRFPLCEQHFVTQSNHIPGNRVSTQSRRKRQQQGSLFLRCAQSSAPPFGIQAAQPAGAKNAAF